MRCTHVRKIMNAYVGDELSGSARAEVAAHLESCEPCRMAWARLDRLGRMIRDENVPGCPEGLAETILLHAQELLHDRQTEHVLGVPFALNRFGREILLPWAAILVVILGGLAIGTLIARTVWEAPDRMSVVQPGGVSDPALLYRLDYLGGTPEESIEMAILGRSTPPSAGK